MPLTADDLEVLRRELSELPTTRPRTVTKQRAIAELAPELAAAQRRGYTVEDLAQLLADRGLAMTPGTLRGYLRRNRKKRRAGKPGSGASQQPIGGNVIVEGMRETAARMAMNDARPPAGTPATPSPAKTESNARGPKT
jgi:hypothetical protein